MAWNSHDFDLPYLQMLRGMWHLAFSVNTWVIKGVFRTSWFCIFYVQVWFLLGSSNCWCVLTMSWDSLQVPPCPDQGCLTGKTVWQQKFWRKLKEVGEKAGEHRSDWKVGEGKQRLTLPPCLHHSQSGRFAHQGFTPRWYWGLNCWVDTESTWRQATWGKYIEGCKEDSTALRCPSVHGVSRKVSDSLNPRTISIFIPNHVLPLIQLSYVWHKLLPISCMD